MQIHPQTFNAIERALEDPHIVAGATGAWPERWSLGLAATVAVMLPIVILARIDTGVVFCRRSDYEAVGGYREDRLFAEDVAFLAALWRRGRQRGQHLTRVTTARAIASTRKFDKYGEWHYFRLPWVMIVAAFRDPANQHWAKRYWYEDR
jgi:hypothetical protein